MSWKIGAVTLPVPPKRITKKNKVSLKKINIGIEAPWIYYMGPDAKQLALEGETLEMGRTAKSGLFSDYVEKFEKYTERGMAISIPLLDIAPTGTWSSGASISGFRETGDRYVKNNESLYVIFGSGDRDIYYEFSDELDFSDYNLSSWWAIGSGTEKFKVTFYNEEYGSKANGYRGYIQCASEVWNRASFVMSSVDGSPVMVDVGTPTGWNSIRTVTIQPSHHQSDRGYYFDMGTIGVGWELTSPRGEYDGIWLIQDYEYAEENSDNEVSYKYKIQLVDETEFFGKQNKVV